VTEYVTITGLKELRIALIRTVPQHFQGKVLQKALAAGAKPMIADAQIRAPVKTGKLERSIYSYRDRRGSTRTKESRFIGVGTKGKLGAFYWKFIEFGRGVISTTGRTLGTPESGFFGKTVRAVPAKPFLRPAFEATKNQSVAVIKTKLQSELEIAAKKAHWGGPSSFSSGSSWARDLIG
jgi:HK97 gp10 family phage protein